MRVRKMIGEALTMRFQATLDLLVQLAVGDLKGINFCACESEQEIRPVQPSNFSGPRLRYYAARIPVNRRRLSELTRENVI
jgi:hypothetical protein